TCSEDVLPLVRAKQAVELLADNDLRSPVGRLRGLVKRLNVDADMPHRLSRHSDCRPTKQNYGPCQSQSHQHHQHTIAPQSAGCANSLKNALTAPSAPWSSRSTCPPSGKRTIRFGSFASVKSLSPKPIGTIRSRSPCSTSNGAFTRRMRSSERNGSFMNRRTGKNG